MATPQVTDHIELAWEFLRRSRDYLANDDLHQASEKAWGAAAHIMKAVAAERGWEYEHHDEFTTTAQKAGAWYRQSSLRSMAKSANELHQNYYKRKVLLDTKAIEEDIDDVERMVSILIPFLAEESEARPSKPTSPPRSRPDLVGTGWVVGTGALARLVNSPLLRTPSGCGFSVDTPKGRMISLPPVQSPC